MSYEWLADLQHVMAKTPAPDIVLSQECMRFVGMHELFQPEGRRQVSRAAFLMNTGHMLGEQVRTTIVDALKCLHYPELCCPGSLKPRAEP